MYKLEIERYYRAELLNSFLENTDVTYNDALKEKAESAENWSNIVHYFKSLGYARDVSNASHLHTNTLIIGIKGIKEGIILNISFLPKLIGFYFYHQTEKSSFPIINKFGVTNDEVSLFPFTEKQLRHCCEIIDFVNKYFPDFYLFNNIYALKKISDVIIDGSIRNDSYYFHVIFEDNIYSIF